MEDHNDARKIHRQTEDQQNDWEQPGEGHSNDGIP